MPSSVRRSLPLAVLISDSPGFQKIRGNAIADLKPIRYYNVSAVRVSHLHLLGAPPGVGLHFDHRALRRGEHGLEWDGQAIGDRVGLYLQPDAHRRTHNRNV